MEEICHQIEKEIKILKDKNEYKNESVCELTFKNFNIQKKEEITKETFKNQDISKIIEKLKSFEEEDFYFRKLLYKKLSEEDLLTFVSQKTIPSNYKLQVIEYIMSLNNKNNSIEGLKSIIKINKSTFLENEVLYILSHISDLEMNKEIISLLISEISIDHNYLLQLLKKDETNSLKKNEVILLNSCFLDSDNISDGWIDFIKTLNFISYIKKRIVEEEFLDFQQKISDKYEDFKSKDINGGNSSRLNIELIRKIQNRGNILQENIFV